MTETVDAAAEDAEEPKKKSKGLLFGLIGALLLGGGAFYAVYSGMIALPFGGDEKAAESADAKGGDKGSEKEPDIHDKPPMTAAFVPLDAIIIALGAEAKAKHLKANFVVEVEPGQEAAVEALKPRIIDVLNVFLRAVETRDLETPRAMARLRAQMLRRVKLVTPEGSVRDVLIQEFVLN